jgi:endonuclease/exonuclease/phosphatase (EEP) superfamily protein YafD
MNEQSATTPATETQTARGRASPTRGRWQRLFVAAAWLIVGASYLVTVFAFAFPHDFRNSAPAYVWAAWTAFMIRTFLFHLGLLLCALAIAVVLLRRWRLLVATLPLLLFCVGPALWSYVPGPKPVLVGDTVTVMSANLLGSNQNTRALVAEVVAAQADVVMLLEYRPHWHQAFQPALSSTYPFASYVQRPDNFGLAIYSRLPLREPASTQIPLGSAETPQARAVAQIGGREIAFYVVHLMPPKGRRRTAEQRREFADLLKQLEREKLPIVLCGDFNFTNASVFADELRRMGLIDAHLISGWGRGSTWSVLGFYRYLPGLRLDHFYLSKELSSAHCRTGTGAGSDHRPVIAEIGFAGE